MTTLEAAFEEFKKLPDWELYPLPEVFYKHFNVKKPKPASVAETTYYSPPPHHSLNKNGKVEIRGPAEGGVRQIDQFLELPVEVKMIEDETGELKDYPDIKEIQKEKEEAMNKIFNSFIKKTAADTQQDSAAEMLSPPKEDNNSEILPGWDHQSPDLSCDAVDNAPSAPCRDAECSPPSQPLQNESS